MKREPEFLTLEAGDVGGRYWWEVTIQPRSQQDDLQRMQLAQAFRAPGPDGKPLMSDRDIARFVIRDPHPEETEERAVLEWLEKNDPEVMKIRTTALRERWRKENKELVREYERAQQPEAKWREMMRSISPEEFKVLVQAAAESEHAKMLGMDPAQMMAGAQGMAETQAAAQQAQSLAPPTALPYQETGPSPETMPTQTMMNEAPQPMEATPQVLAMQARRGRPQP